MKKGNAQRLPALLGTGLLILAGTLCVEAQTASARSVLDRILGNVVNEKPVIRQGRVVLPDSRNADYEVIIGGSSNQSVIATDGSVRTPLETMDVHLLYKVVNKNDPQDAAMSNSEDVVVTVPGQYTPGKKDNARPQVLPGIREWKGGTGTFQFTRRSRIVLQDASMRPTGEQIQYYLEKIARRPIQVVVGEPARGDLYFSLPVRTDLGAEGYAIDLGEVVSIEAASAIGNLYAAVTLSQILSQSPGRDELPKGLIRDYPAYKSRGCMLDVARIYIPLDYLEEVTKYMSYFKINEIQVHINDDGGEQHASFRVESKLFPAINSGLNPSQVYSQEAYRQYQKTAAAFGVDVITEIDSPAHCRFVALYNPAFMLDDSHIDLKNDEAIAFMKRLYDEFLDGEDPVFQSKTFHIGADEYHRGPTYGEDFNRYLNTMIDYVNKKGLAPRMWASLGGGGLVGQTPVDNRVTCNYWAYSWADFDKMVKEGFRVLNNSHDLYTVPGRRTAYDDYFKLKKMYCGWETPDLSGGWPVLSPAHPLLEGCQASIWYDRKVGTSEFDYFDRLKDQVVFIAEKGWFGAKLENQSCEGFMQRVALFQSDVPGVNPLRKVASKSDLVASYDFKSTSNAAVKDLSGNRYDATLEGLQTANGALRLDGKGSLRLPFNAIGFPYTVSFDLYIDPATPAKAVLFDGSEGTFYLNFDGKGNPGYRRKGQNYVLPCNLPTGEWQRVTLTCDKSALCLYLNGEKAAQGRYLEDAETIPESSTFVLPVHSIGSGVTGEMKNLTVHKKVLF